MKKSLHALILEDYESDALLLLRELRRGGYEVNYQIVDNAADLKTALDNQQWDIILSDYSMPGFNAPAALKIIRDQGFDTPFIIVSGTVGEDVAVASMKAGAQDFFSKDKLTRLIPAVERELQEARERRLRREAEAQYQQAEARFAKAFHASPIGSAISRLSDGKALDINQRFTELFGYSREEIIGKSGVELNLWVNQEQRQQLVQQLQREGSVHSVEIEFQHRTGKRGYALLSAEVIDLDNEPCILTMVHDISARKAAEERLQRSNEVITLLRDIAIAANEGPNVNAILHFTIERICAYTHWDIGHAYLVPKKDETALHSVPIWHIDDERRFDSFRQFTETSFDAAQKGFIRLILDSQQPHYWENIDKQAEFVRSEAAAACGLHSGFAFPIMASQSVVGVFEFFSTRPVNELDRALLNITTHIGTQVGRLIERQWSDAALRESEERYEALFDHSLNAVYIHDAQGHFIDANPAALHMLGYKRAELPTLSFESLIPPADLERAQRELRETLELGYQPQAAEYQLRCKDGHLIDVEVISSVIYQDDQPWAIQGIARNITERKRAYAEEQVRRLFAEALHETTASLLAGTLSIDEMLKRILNYAAGLIPCDAATLIREEAGMGRVIHCQGFDERDVPHIMHAILEINKARNLREMAHSQQPLIIADTRSYDAWRTDRLPEVTKINSYLGAPIMVGDKLFGFINLDSRMPNHFIPEHADRLKILTDQAAVAIHNAQLYQQIQEYTHRLELLHEIDLAILRADQPQTIAQTVLGHLQSLMHYQNASITTFDLERDQFTVLAATAPIPPLFAAGTQYRFEDLSIIERLQKNEIYIVDDLQEVANPSPSDQSLLAAGVRSYARLPLLSGSKLLGSINFRAMEPHVFSSENLAIVREVAAQLAIAIENARLLAVERRRNQELTALHWASLELTNTLILDDVLDTILNYLHLLLGTKNTNIFLYDGQTLTFGAAMADGEKQDVPFAQPRQNGVTYTVARSGQRLVISDMSAHPLYEGTGWQGAIASVPLTIANEVKGVLSVAFTEPHIFDEYEIRLLELLADQAATAVQNAQLYERVQRHAGELEDRVIERTQQLQQAKDRVEAILNNSSDSIILADKAGRINQTNPGFSTAFDYPPDALLGQPLVSFVTAEYVEQFDQTIQDVLQDQTARHIEIVVKRRDQSTFPADALVACFAEGNKLEIVCSLRDISLQKQVEAELRLALEKEKELNQLKTNFTSVVSHEFRTPLAVIMTSASTLLSYFDRITSERRKEKLEIIKMQVQHLTRLMDDVLVITRSEAVGFELKPQPLDLSALCKRIINDVQVGFSNNVTVDYRYKCNYELVIADHFLLNHILQNLVSNAIKYSRDNSQVTVEVTCTTNEIILKVEDQGIGIPERHQSKLFESFHRASNVAHIQGTGIGLTIVKRAVDAYGGEIDFESKEGKGTTFVVKLPHGDELDW